MARPTNKLTQRKGERGFTMIELMVTIIVLAILTSAGLPFYRSFITSQRIKTASFDLMALITYTRSEAIKRNTSVTLNSNGGNFTNGSTFTVTTGGATLKTQPMFTGILLDCVAGPNANHVYTSCPATGIVYNGNGRLPPATPFLPIELHEINAAADSAAPYRCITIDLSGRPSSKKGAC